jgi:hypothetical protein
VGSDSKGHGPPIMPVESMCAYSHIPSQVTISLLSPSLSLVHIPRSRLSHLSHPILRHVLTPNPPFLNITCNEIELSIFAEHHTIAHFDLFARRDRKRVRSRASFSSASGHSISKGGSKTESIEISYDRWNVLQIDSHSDELGGLAPSRFCCAPK